MENYTFTAQPNDDAWMRYSESSWPEEKIDFYRYMKKQLDNELAEFCQYLISINFDTGNAIYALRGQHFLYSPDIQLIRERDGHDEIDAWVKYQDFYPIPYSTLNYQVQKEFIHVVKDMGQHGLLVRRCVWDRDDYGRWQDPVRMSHDDFQEQSGEFVVEGLEIPEKVLGEWEDLQANNDELRDNFFKHISEERAACVFTEEDKDQLKSDLTKLAQTWRDKVAELTKPKEKRKSWWG